MSSLRTRRFVTVVVVAVSIAIAISANPDSWHVDIEEAVSPQQVDVPAGDDEAAHNHKDEAHKTALEVLGSLPVKGRAPKTGYLRAQFGNGWALIHGCDTRNIILARDMTGIETNDKCQVVRGTLKDPYTGKDIQFTRGPETSQEVQIDHVVALSNAWQTGAQQLTEMQRIEFANDPQNLLAVDGKANQNKADSDAASWLPPYKAFRCQYVARQIAVKSKYNLWVVPPEKEAMTRVLSMCPSQQVLQ